MSVPSTTITFHPLRRFDSPQHLLGAGFLAGLLVFCVWLWSQPDEDRRTVRARGNGAVSTSAAEAGAGGVLGGITAAGGRRGNFISSSGEDDSAFLGEEAADEQSELQAEASIDEAYAAGESDFDPNRMAIGEDVGAPPPMEEGAALTDRLLDAPPSPMAPAFDPAAGPPGAPLLPYFVEVEIAPGQVQLLQLNAESPEHALAILRDFRGDPRVLRGPSTEPLQ